VYKELIKLVHAIPGILAVLSAVWIIFELKNTDLTKKVRVKVASIVLTASIWFSCIIGGILYVKLYSADKPIIKNGPWSWAHSIFMETKEHIFFLLLTLSLLIPIVIFTEKTYSNKNVKRLILTTLALVILLVLLITFFGIIVVLGLQMGIKGGK
jgi:hypothetical protein